jgi:hypothetical protein
MRTHMGFSCRPGPAAVCYPVVDIWYYAPELKQTLDFVHLRASQTHGRAAFVVAQMLVALAVVAVVTLTHNWTAFGHFFTTVRAPALTGVLAALTIPLGLGGFSTMRATIREIPRHGAGAARRAASAPRQLPLLDESGPAARGARSLGRVGM